MIMRPILFSGAMVRALLDGSKTQTRRALKVRCQEIGERDDGSRWPWSENPNTAGDHWHICPYGQVGDRLWVRETFVHIDDDGDKFDGMGTQTYYRASCPDPEHDTAWLKKRGLKWTPSIHMPRAASRILLEIVSVRVERLNDCSKLDAIAEGIHRYDHSWRDCEYPLPDVAYEPVKGWPTRYSCPIQAYQALWESINGAGSWEANPWVWVVEFKQVAP